MVVIAGEVRVPGFPGTGDIGGKLQSDGLGRFSVRWWPDRGWQAGGGWGRQAGGGETVRGESRLLSDSQSDTWRARPSARPVASTSSFVHMAPLSWVQLSVRSEALTCHFHHHYF